MSLSQEPSDKYNGEEKYVQDITFVALLKHCAEKKNLGKGIRIHAEILKRNLLERNHVIGSTLISMYTKCGIFSQAHQVFEELLIRDIVTWNALIAGHAQQGQGQEALKCIERMHIEGLMPNEVTLLCVLSACSHSGLLDEAQMLWRDMTKSYEITPSLEHHACMVLAFGCAGEFDKAISVIMSMPPDSPAVWIALLGACRNWGNIELGGLAFYQAVQLDDSRSAAYVLMASMFQSAGMEYDARKIEEN